MGAAHGQGEFERLRAFAREHGGCFTRANAYQQGISQHAFDVAVRRRHFLRYRGVYTLAGTEDTGKTRIWAALLRAGPGAVVTGYSALSIYQFDGLALCVSRIESLPAVVAVPRERHLRIGPVVVLRDTSPSVDHRIVDGVPVVERSRAVVDSLRLLDRESARQLLYRTLQLRVVTAEYLQEMCEVLTRARGISQLRAMALDARSGSHAESETRMHWILRELGVGFTANVAAYDSGGLIGYVDIAICHGERKIAIEVDGRAWHTDHDRFRRDKKRQNRLIDAGWLVFRYTWEDVTTDRASTLADLRRRLSR